MDHFHLVMLANKAVTAVRHASPVTCSIAGAVRPTRSGRTGDCCCAGGNGCPIRRWRGCGTGASITTRPVRSCRLGSRRRNCARCAPLPRAVGTATTSGARLWAFYSWCADAQIPELVTLAETIETWWPAIEVFLTTGLTNARTEGTNRLIKQVKRAACGFRNRENYRRRVRLHCTRRPRRLSAGKPTVPVKVEEPPTPE